MENVGLHSTVEESHFDPPLCTQPAKLFVHTYAQGPVGLLTRQLQSWAPTATPAPELAHWGDSAPVLYVPEMQLVHPLLPVVSPLYMPGAHTVHTRDVLAVATPP